MKNEEKEFWSLLAKFGLASLELATTGAED
jgi:hypothetical protein